MASTRTWLEAFDFGWLVAGPHLFVAGSGPAAAARSMSTNNVGVSVSLKNVASTATRLQDAPLKCIRYLLMRQRARSRVGRLSASTLHTSYEPAHPHDGSLAHASSCARPAAEISRSNSSLCRPDNCPRQPSEIIDLTSVGISLVSSSSSSRDNAGFASPTWPTLREDVAEAEIVIHGDSLSSQLGDMVIVSRAGRLV